MVGFRIQLGILWYRLNIVLVIVFKGKVVLVLAMKAYTGTEMQLHSFLTSK
jgi:hypothetical protein